MQHLLRAVVALLDNDVEAVEGLGGGGVALGARVQTMAHGIHQQRQARDALHGQEEEGGHGQELAVGMLLQSLHCFHKVWPLPAEGGKKSYKENTSPTDRNEEGQKS